MRRFAAAGLSGWAIIMALGWWLADRRAMQCPNSYNCTVHELGTRDTFLVLGLLVPFLIVAALVFLGARHGAQVRWWPVRDNAPLLARTGAREAAPRARLRPLRLLQGIRPWTGAAIGAAFAVGWLCAYLVMGWIPVRSVGGEMSKEAREAAIDAMEAAREGPLEAVTSPRLVPVPGDPFAEPPPTAEPARNDDRPGSDEDNAETANEEN